MDRLERLLTLLMVLLETPRPLSAEELREQIGGYRAIETPAAFHRAFERDKDSLREMGIPLRVLPVPGADPPRDGYRVLPDEYYLRDPGLAADELAALHLAATTVRLEGIQGVQALWKLGGVVPTDEAPLAGGRAALPGDPRLPALFDAVTAHRVASFTYRGTPRRLEPYRLRIDRGHWYLEAAAVGTDELRSFRVDRIEGDVAVGEAGAFQPPDELPERGGQPWELGDGPAVTARVAVDADQAPWALQHLGEATHVERSADGGIVATLEVVDRDAFRSFVLTFLEHAEVLDPPELRDELVAWLEEVP